MKFQLLGILLIGSTFGAALGCSSAAPVKTQAYARLAHTRTFEYSFPVVWKALENTLRNYKVTHRDPDEVEPLEMEKLTRRTLETDWIFAQSRDKYTEYQVNGTPRRVPLQMKYKYLVEAQKVIGGVTVKVRTEEEIEKLKSDGTSAGYSTMAPDPSRPSELLEKLNISILAAPNT